MKSIAMALHHGQTTTVDTPPSENSVDPFALQDLAATEVLCRALERMEQRLKQLLEDADDGLRHRAAIAVEHARGQIELGHQRDAIQASRPTGCWCLGAGGKERRYLQTWDDSDPVEVLTQYCSCPDGVARQAQDTINCEQHRMARQQFYSERIFRNSGVPPRFKDVTFESYPVSPTTREVLDVIRNWADRGAESLLIYGSFGTGKTGLAVAAMRQRIALHGPDALFLTTPGLLDRIRQTYSSKRDGEVNEADVLEAVRSMSLLVLDDLGAERPTDWVQEKLFTIINHRHDAFAPTIFTSNLDPEGLARHLGERIAWRIIEMSLVVKLDGPNLRDRA